MGLVRARSAGLDAQAIVDHGQQTLLGHRTGHLRNDDAAGGHEHRRGQRVQAVGGSDGALGIEARFERARSRTPR